MAAEQCARPRRIATGWSGRRFAPPLNRSVGREQQYRQVLIVMDDTVRIHCNSCGRDTRHAIRSSHTAVRDDLIEGAPGETFEEKTTLEILQCLGCEELSVRESAEHEAFGTAIPRFYPPRISRRTPPWTSKLPQAISAVVHEVYRALQADSPRLATIGARTVVDLVILDKVDDVGSFAEKLTALESQGYVGRRNREFISAALEAGSAAAHRGVAPDIADLNRVMDIVESLLESVYVLEDAADRLRQAIPPRPPRKKRGE